MAQHRSGAPAPDDGRDAEDMPDSEQAETDEILDHDDAVFDDFYSDGSDADGPDAEHRAAREEARARARAAESMATPMVVEAARKAIERAVLGGERKYDRNDVAELSGLDAEHCRDIWTAMGFAVPPEAESVNYTDSDVDALRVLKDLSGSGVLTPEVEGPIVRATGQAMSRLADWQVSLVTEFLLQELMRDRESAGVTAPLDEATVTSIVEETGSRLLPAISELQTQVWRRHLAAAAERMILRTREEDESRPLAIGFADMVGYTHLTRRIDIEELSALLDQFESISARVIAEHHGRIIKNVGDEVMFSADDPDTAALIGIALQDAIGETPSLPKIRVGIAYGDVLVRFGDAYGAVVNIAARLTGAAKPGTVLVDETLAESITPPDGLTTRSMRPVKVHGYSRLKAKQLRRHGKHRARVAGEATTPSAEA